MMKYMNKKIFLAIIVIIGVLLYVAIILNQMQVLSMGDVFGYTYYAVVIAGIAAAVFFGVKSFRKR
jgi:hypothetical protein